MAHQEVMDCKKTTYDYRGDNLYAVLTYDADGNPHAVQFSISGKVINHDHRTLSNIDALARMTSLCLREYDLEYVIANLLANSRVKDDLAGIIADLLINHGGSNVFKTE